MIADGKGRAIAFRLAPGQAHELPHAVPLLDSLPRVPKWVVGDRGYASHAFRQHIWDLGARPAIPPKRNEAPVACPDYIYSNRNLVERLLLVACRAAITRDVELRRYRKKRSASGTLYGWVPESRRAPMMASGRCAAQADTEDQGCSVLGMSGL